MNLDIKKHSNTKYSIDTILVKFYISLNLELVGEF